MLPPYQFYNLVKHVLKSWELSAHKINFNHLFYFFHSVKNKSQSFHVKDPLTIMNPALEHIIMAFPNHDAFPDNFNLPKQRIFNINILLILKEFQTFIESTLIIIFPATSTRTTFILLLSTLNPSTPQVVQSVYTRLWAVIKLRRAHPG